MATEDYTATDAAAETASEHETASGTGQANPELYSYFVSAVVTTWWVIVLTLGSEFIPGFKSTVAMLGGHHWLGKSILTFVVFVVVAVAVPKQEFDEEKWTKYTIGSVAVAYALIGLYYILHFLGAI